MTLIRNCQNNTKHHTFHNNVQVEAAQEHQSISSLHITKSSLLVDDMRPLHQICNGNFILPRYMPALLVCHNSTLGKVA